MLRFSTIASPFVYEEPVEPRRSWSTAGRACGRSLDRRSRRATAGLEGPRRFGKTSLLRAVLARPSRRRRPVEVNFLGCVSRRCGSAHRAGIRALNSTARCGDWFDGLVRTLQPTVSAAPAGVGSRPSRRSGAGAARPAGAARRIQERPGRRCVDRVRRVPGGGPDRSGAARRVPLGAGDARAGRRLHLLRVASRSHARPVQRSPARVLRPGGAGRVSGRCQPMRWPSTSRRASSGTVATRARRWGRYWTR